MKRAKNIIGGVSLALVLTLAAGTGFMLLAAGSVEVLDGLLPPRQPPHGHFERLGTRNGGSLVIVRWEPHTLNTFDLDHQPIERPEREKIGAAANLDAGPAEDHWLRDSIPRNKVKHVAGASAGEEWYAVLAGNRSPRFYFHGVKIAGKETLGYIGRDGFQESQPIDVNQFLRPPRQLQSDLDWFVSKGDNQLIFLDERRLLSVDFKSRSVERVIEGEIISMDRLDKEISEGGVVTMSAQTAVWAARTSEEVIV